MLYRVPALLAFRPVHCPPVCLTLIIKADPLQPESRRYTAVSPGPFCFSSPRLELVLKSKTSATPKGFHQHFWNWSGWQVCLRWTQFGRVPPLLVILTDAVALRRTGQRSRNFWHLNNDNKKKERKLMIPVWLFQDLGKSGVWRSSAEEGPISLAVNQTNSYSKWFS